MAAAVMGFLAGVMLMIVEHAPVFCREMGALYLVATALFVGIFVMQIVRIFFLLRQAESQKRIIDSQGKSIESLRSIINKRRGDAGWLS